MDLWDVPGMWGDLWGLSEGGRVRGFRGEFATVCAVVWGRWHACVGFGRCLEYWSVGFGVWWEGWVVYVGSWVPQGGREVRESEAWAGWDPGPRARGGARRQGAGPCGTWAGRKGGPSGHRAGPDGRGRGLSGPGPGGGEGPAGARTQPARPLPAAMLAGVWVSNRAGSGCDSSGSSRSRLLSSAGGRSRAPGSARRSAGEPGPRGSGAGADRGRGPCPSPERPQKTAPPTTSQSMHPSVPAGSPPQAGSSLTQQAPPYGLEHGPSSSGSSFLCRDPPPQPPPSPQGALPSVSSEHRASRARRSSGSPSRPRRPPFLWTHPGPPPRAGRPRPRPGAGRPALGRRGPPPFRRDRARPPYPTAQRGRGRRSQTPAAFCSAWDGETPPGGPAGLV